jgi:hypothetical protein
MKISRLLANAALLTCSAAHAGPLETLACEDIAGLTPAELQQIQASIATSTGRAPAIIEAAKGRYFACMVAAVAADTVKATAAAAAVVAGIAAEK